MGGGTTSYPAPVVQAMAATYDVDTDATLKLIGKAPAKSMFVGYALTKPEAFTAASTVTIGWAGDTAALLADATIAPTNTTLKAGSLAVETGTSDRDVIFTVSEGGAAGRMNLVLYFVPMDLVFGLTPTVA